MEKKQTKRDVIVKSREQTLITLGYNINKICFLPKVYDTYNNYSAYNKLRVISHILSNNFKTAYYITDTFIKENNLTLKEKEFGFVYEYLKLIDDELGKKEYNMFIKFNAEQLIEEDYEKAIEILKKEIQIEEDKRYYLTEKHLNTYFEEKKYDELDKAVFIAFLRITTGKEVDLKIRYSKESKEVLIDYLKEYEKEFLKKVLEIDKDVIDYLNNHQIKEVKNYE